MSSKVNEVNGENLQDPPIENPVYANGRPYPINFYEIFNFDIPWRRHLESGRRKTKLNAGTLYNYKPSAI